MIAAAFGAAAAVVVVVVVAGGASMVQRAQADSTITTCNGNETSGNTSGNDSTSANHIHGHQ